MENPFFSLSGGFVSCLAGTCLSLWLEILSSSGAGLLTTQSFLSAVNSKKTRVDAWLRYHSHQILVKPHWVLSSMLFSCQWPHLLSWVRLSEAGFIHGVIKGNHCELICSSCTTENLPFQGRPNIRNGKSLLFIQDWCPGRCWQYPPLYSVFSSWSKN